MADDKKINEKKQRLLTLLREMFQLDQPDLDFGLYRIMHAKRGQVEAFLETEFDQLIDKVFADRGARHEEEAKKEYEAARQQAIEFGAPDPDAAPKVQQARARYDVIRLTGGEDTEIYDHLHRFFSRYYDQGDFMSLRRYGKGAAGGAETYAVPYDGSEVVLHWANKDQYYIKTTENFAEFSFDPRKALQKDERGISRSLFDDAAANVGAGGTALKVHFRIVEAAEGAHNNVKASDKDERYFILDDQAPNAWDGTELVIPINYRPDPEKSGQKSKWQEKRNEQLVEKVLETLKGAAQGGHTLAKEYFEVLSREVPKGKDKKQPLLARYVGQYTASNTMDYFIHKDLGGFLRRELDFYLKNEVLKLDDFVGGEDADVQAGLTDARMKAMKEALEKTQAIRLLSQRLIDFLAQLEDFQKKLWLKKKFVVETHYCITLDRIPEKFYPEIAANERQREEWVKLFAIDEIKGDLASPEYSVPLTIEFLKSNQHLIVDSALLGADLEQSIASSIDNLDDQIVGLLVHSENYQGVSALSERYRKKIKSVYIDPPYNTGGDGFPYKDSYQHSSWGSMLFDRIRLAKPVCNDRANFFISLDDTEADILRACMRETGWERLGEFVWKTRNADNRVLTKFSLDHESIHAYCTPNGALEGRTIDRSDYKNSDNDPRGPYTTDPLTGKANAAARPNCHYTVVNPDTGDIYPPDPDYGWITDKAGFDDLIKKKLVFWPANPKTGKPRKKRFANEAPPKAPISSFGISISQGEGNQVLADMMGFKAMNFPKPVSVISTVIDSSSDHDDIILDYFAGSGTTGHAVINLNRVPDGPQRRYVLVEQGGHFDTILRPRILKAIYSAEWSQGKPVNCQTGISHCLKYVRLESYEDCINNLVLNRQALSVQHAGDVTMQRDYLLRYMLDVETQGSQSLLNVGQFRDPTAYQLEIKKPGSDEREKRNVDLVETFNWLIGLHVDKLLAGRRFTATFARKPDPLLPEDANTRLQVETLTEAEDGAWWFRPVEGYIRTKPGDDRHRQSVLVLWRTLTDDPEQDAAALEAYLSQQMKFDPTRREDKTLYDIIYINGTHNLPNLGKYGEVRLLEEEFHRRMWAIEEN